MNYSEAVKKLNNFVRIAGIKPGLQRITSLLGYLRNPHSEIPAIHIAGTNGKGSVTLMTTNVLRECDYRVGTYLSPHLVEYTERFLLNGKEISKTDFARIFTLVEKAARRVKGITEFEILTAMAFVYFREQAVDVAVLETGLGGRYDATNVCRPVLVIITPISYDHEAVLGNTLAKIAGEKAGIIKKNIPVASAAQEPEAMRVILNQVEKYENEFKVVTHPLKFKLQLSGRMQNYNAALVLEAMRLLMTKNFYIPRRLILNGIQKTIVPARLQQWQDNPPFFVDVAHNPQSFQNLVTVLAQKHPFRPIVLVLGLMKRKNLPKILEGLKDKIDLLIAVDLPDDSYSAAEIAQSAKAIGINTQCQSNIFLACELARKEAKNRRGIAAAAGSFCVAGAIFRKYKLPRNISVL